MQLTFEDFIKMEEIDHQYFPWAKPTNEQKEKIMKTAQGILDARKLYPDCSLAVMSNSLRIP